MANTTRMELRIGKSVKAAAEKAAALKGRKSLTEYVVDLIEKDAEAVIREHQLITLNDAVFDHFMATCNGENAPNKKLREAKEFTK